MEHSTTTYIATRRAAIYASPSVKATTAAWVLRGQAVPGRPAGEGWIAVERDGVVLGYVKAGALQVVQR